VPRIDLTTVLPAGRAVAFDTSLDVGMHGASLRWQHGKGGERAVAGVTNGRLGPGESVTWQARHFGIRWQMTSYISEYERPYRFVDEQVRGPFRSWRHEHVFVAPDPTATMMRDLIEFTAPAGVLGQVVAAAVLRPYLRRLIRRRNAYLARVLAALTSGPLRPRPPGPVR
jgi:ligand-binding SRPBCC domain-containing protein